MRIANKWNHHLVQKEFFKLLLRIRKKQRNFVDVIGENVVNRRIDKHQPPKKLNGRSHSSFAVLSGAYVP